MYPSPEEDCSSVLTVIMLTLIVFLNSFVDHVCIFFLGDEAIRRLFSCEGKDPYR